jgi:hypothetical protein
MSKYLVIEELNLENNDLSGIEFGFVVDFLECNTSI